jgi:hypothetical protein
LTVEHDKPESSSSLLTRKQAESLAHAERCIQAGRQAVARARCLMEDSQNAITRADALCARRGLFCRASRLR